MDATHSAACALIALICGLLQGYIKLADASEEDLIERLSIMYKAKADGKEQQMDVDSLGPVMSSTQEVRSCSGVHVGHAEHCVCVCVH